MVCGLASLPIKSGFTCFIHCVFCVKDLPLNCTICVCTHSRMQRKAYYAWKYDGDQLNMCIKIKCSKVIVTLHFIESKTSSLFWSTTNKKWSRICGCCLNKKGNVTLQHDTVHKDFMDWHFKLQSFEQENSVVGELKEVRKGVNYSRKLLACLLYIHQKCVPWPRRYIKHLMSDRRSIYAFIS